MSASSRPTVRVRSSERVYRLPSNPLIDDRVEFSLAGLSSKEEDILSSLPFSDVDEASELLFFHNLAIKRYHELHHGTQDIAADAWDAEKYLRRACSLEKMIEGLEKHQFEAPAHDIHLKRVRSAQKLKGFADAVRLRVGEANRVSNFINKPLPKDVGVISGHIGTVSSVLDLVFEFVSPIRKIFLPKKLNEPESKGKRFYNNLNKDDRPFRIFNATLGVGLSIAGYVVMGLAATVMSIGSPFLFFGMTCIEVWRDIAPYNSILEKLDNKIEHVNKHKRNIVTRIERLDKKITDNKKYEIDGSQHENAIFAKQIKDLNLEVDKCDEEIRSLHSIRQKTEVKKEKTKTDGYWKIGRSFLISGGILICIFAAPEVAAVVAWGLLALGVGMLCKKVYDHVKECRDLAKLEKEREKLAKEGDADSEHKSGHEMTPSPRSSNSRLSVLSAGLLAPPSSPSASPHGQPDESASVVASGEVVKEVKKVTVAVRPGVMTSPIPPLNASDADVQSSSPRRAFSS